MGDYLVVQSLQKLSLSQLKKLANEFRISPVGTKKQLIQRFIIRKYPQQGAGKTGEEMRQQCQNNETVDEDEELAEDEMPFIDPILGLPIQESDVIVIDRACFSKTALKTWVATFTTKPTKPTNPLTNQALEWSVIEQLGFVKSDFPLTFGYVPRPQARPQDRPPARAPIQDMSLMTINVGASVRSVAYAPDGQRIVSGSDDETLRQWNAATGSQIGAPLTGHTSWVLSVAYAPDGQRIVSGSRDGTLRQWNAATGSQIGAPLTGHTSWVLSVAYAPDGQRIVSGSDDWTIRQWNAHAEL